MKKHIPNALTIGNLLCGCIAIIQVFNGELVFASIFVGAALIFDFLDGFSARLLKVSSPIGKELDSLADLVTFGVVPTFIMYQLMIGVLPALDQTTENGMIVIVDRNLLNTPILWSTLFIAALSALRLAKFNVDTRQSDSFIGLPTPACASVIASIPLIQLNDDYGIFEVIYNPIALAVISVVLALMLVIPLPLLALKFKSFAWKTNVSRYLLILASIIAIIVFKYTAVPLIVLLYIFVSVFSLKSNNN